MKSDDIKIQLSTSLAWLINRFFTQSLSDFFLFPLFHRPSFIQKTEYRSPNLVKLIDKF